MVFNFGTLAKAPTSFRSGPLTTVNVNQSSGNPFFLGSTPGVSSVIFADPDTIKRKRNLEASYQRVLQEMKEKKQRNE